MLGCWTASCAETGCLVAPVWTLDQSRNGLVSVPLVAASRGHAEDRAITALHHRLTLRKELFAHDFSVVTTAFAAQTIL